jgi:hypothetical protein
MKSASRNDDFMYLAVAPVLAALLFFIFYVGGWAPPIPVPQFAVPWASELNGVRDFASQNQTSAIGLLAAVVVGTIGLTWFVMIVLDLKRGMLAFKLWVLRRPPRHVSGLLREDENPTWSLTMAADSEPTKTYKAKSSDWMRERPE